MIPTPFDDLIDSRDVIERIDDIEQELEDETLTEDDQDALKEELADLQELAEEGELECPDWPYGETLIAHNYFTEYTQQLAEDIGALPTPESTDWPMRHIDWPAAAEELQQDYVELSYAGNIYWARSA